MVGIVGGSTARAEHVVANAGGETEYVRRLHRHAPAEHQCTSTLVKHIKAPVHLVSSHPSIPLSRSLACPRSPVRLPARSVPVPWWVVRWLDWTPRVPCRYMGSLRLASGLLFLSDLESSSDS